MKTLPAGAFKGGCVDFRNGFQDQEPPLLEFLLYLPVTRTELLQVSLYRNFPVQRQANFTLSGRLKKGPSFPVSAKQEQQVQ